MVRFIFPTARHVVTGLTEGSSSIGRAPVSKTGGWGFESLLPCSEHVPATDPIHGRTVNRETKRMMARQGQREADGSPASKRPATTAQRPPQARQRTSPPQFAREVRDELRQVAWPSRSELANYTAVVVTTLVLMISLIFVLNFGFGKAVLFLF